MHILNKFIDKLQKRFQLDIKYYIKNTTYLIIARGVILGCVFLLSILFARFLSEEIYGQYNFIFAILGILSIFTLNGMGIAVQQAVANKNEGILITGIKEKFKWSILGSIIVLGVGIYYFLNGSFLLGKCFIISSLFFPFAYNFKIYSSFFAGKKQFNKVSKYGSITAIFSLIIVSLVVYFSGNLIHIIIASLLAISLIEGYFFRLTLKKIKSRSDSSQDTISFGKHISLMNSASVIANQADKIIVGTLFGFSDLAIYSVASVIPRNISTTTTPISRVAFPRLSAMNKNNAYLAVKKKYLYLVLLAVIISVIMVLLAPYFIPLLYSQKYLNSVPYAQLLFIGLIFTIPTQMLGKALFPSQKEIGKLYKFRIMNSIVQLILLFVLTLSFGILGAVLARLLGNAFTMFYSLRLAAWI